MQFLPYFDNLDTCYPNNIYRDPFLHASLKIFCFILKIKTNYPATPWASAQGSQLEEGEKPVRSSLAIHLVTHKSNLHLLARQGQSVESGLCSVGKIVPRPHMCFCLSVHDASQEASAKLSSVPGPRWMLRKLSRDLPAQGWVSSRLPDRQGTSGGKCPRSGGQWERLLGGDQGTATSWRRAQNMPSLLQPWGRMEAPPHIGSHEGCFLWRLCLWIGQMHVQVTFCRQKVKKQKILLISFSCSPVESPRDSREPLACRPLVGRARPGMLAAGTCGSQVFGLQGRERTSGHRSSLHLLLIVIDVFRCIIRQIPSLISQIVFSLYCVPWCSEVLAFDRVHVAYFYFCCLCLCFHIQEVLTKCNVIKIPCCGFFLGL